MSWVIAVLHVTEGHFEGSRVQTSFLAFLNVRSPLRGFSSGRPCVSWPLAAADTFLARKLLVSHHGASWGIIHIFIFALITFPLTAQTSGFLIHTPVSVWTVSAALLFVIVYISWCLPVSVHILSDSRRNHCSLGFFFFFFKICCWNSFSFASFGDIFWWICLSLFS